MEESETTKLRIVYGASSKTLGPSLNECLETGHVLNINAMPTYAWFLLQFWPSSASVSELLHYIARFKVKKMVQARILRT